MQSITFNINYFSKYRLQLMGISALLIIVCHMLSANVEMPNLLKKVVVMGNVGVDMFLFLSGMGLYYSLNRLESSGKSLKSWYMVRFKRILIPYLYLSVPYWIYVCYYNKESITDFFIHLSTLGYWLYHEGAWFIALLIPLYLITPQVYKFFKKPSKFNIIWCFLAILLCAWLSLGIKSESSVIQNIQVCLFRLPSYFIGIALAPFIKRGYEIKWRMLAYILVIAILAELIRRKFDTDALWFIMIITMIVSTVILYISECYSKKFNYYLNFILVFMGTISLESYLANIYLKDILGNYIFTDNSLIINKGNYLMYSLVVVLGIAISVLVNRLSNSKELYKKK